MLWAKLSKPPSKRFKTLASLRWCARLSPDELLQRLDLVSVIQFACGRRRSAGKTSRTATLSEQVGADQSVRARYGRTLRLVQDGARRAL
jgi:hypothetical protein